MLLMLREVIHISGVPVAEVKPSRFAMEPIKGLDFAQLHLQLLKIKPSIFVVAEKQQTSLFVMALIQMENEWESRYIKGTTGWDRGETSPNFLYWLDSGLLKPCRILVPGCGNGYEVLTLAERGFDVVAIDIATTPIKNLTELLKNHQLEAKLIQTDFFTWEMDKPFDAIYEQTSLCALHPEHWQKYENSLYHWLKPDGKLFAQFMQADSENNPPFHCDMDTMNELFTADKWLWSEQHETQSVHSEGMCELLFMLKKIH